MTLPKKIAFFTPYDQENRGNATTANRIKSGLEAKGISVEMFAYEEDEWTESERERLESCDMFHLLHFYRFALWVEKSGYFPSRPYVITAGGTDLNEYLFDSRTFERMNQIIQGSRGVAVFTEDGKEKVKTAFSLASRKVKVIPQSVWFPEQEEDWDATVPKDGFPNILLPAGLRPVKDVLFLLDELRTLKKEFPDLRFVIVGPVLDQQVYEQFVKVSRQFDWLQYGGTASLAAMKNWYRWADVVINSSLSEGQSSAILEAMVMDVPVAARSIPANVSMIRDGQTGILFGDGTEFLEKIHRLLVSNEWRKVIVQNAKRYVDTHHTLMKEIDQYLELYRS